MGSGTWERQGNYLSTGSSGGYTFIRFPNGESFDESTGLATLYFETGFYVNAGNFYGANFSSNGSTVENYQVYGPNAYHVRGWTIQVAWNSHRHFWEYNGYTSYSSGTLSSICEFDWYPTLPTYSIQYNANGGQGAPSNQTKEYGTAVTLSTSIPTRENYNFVGWATSSTATTAAYQAGDSYTANAAVKLYAVWELAFLPPTSVLTAYRVQAGTTTRSAEGTEVYATVEWQANPIDSTDTVQVTSITATLTEDGQAVTAPTVTNPTLPALSGTSTIRFTADTSKRYALTVTVADSNGLSTVKTANVSNIKYPIYVSHDTTNNVDTVKIETLELGEPLGIANGGTGAATALAARAALGIYMGNGEVLYDNPSHNPGDGMRLSAPYTDYDYLVVVCKDNDGAILAPAIIPNPTLGTVFNVMSTYVGSSNGYFYFKVTEFVLTANNGVNDGISWPKDGNNWRTGQMTIGNSGNSWSYSFNIAPILVIGYKS